MQAIVSNLFQQYRRLSRRYFEHAIVQFIERYTIRRARHVIMKAPFVETFIRSLNPDAKLYLLENIIHEAYFAVQRQPDRRRNSVVFVGTLINTKGVEELIGAFHALAGEFPSLEMHLVGTGTHGYVDGILRPMIAAGPGAGRVALHGQLPAEGIAKLFAGASMLVLPSYSDTSPNVVAEALVAGVPVIGTDVGGIPFMIERDRTGLLVPVRDVAALTGAMRQYVRNQPLAEEHARLGCERARMRYGEERFVRSLMAIYEEVLASTPIKGVRRA
jgi:glycosyltransferase involved in cell wall biosynthesis